MTAAVTTKRRHDVRVMVDGREISDWIDYDIQQSLLSPADSFQFTLPFSSEAFELCRTDRRCKVVIDRVVWMDGFIGKRERDRAAGTIVIAGRDKMGRLVDESAPSVNFQGTTMKSLLEKLAAPWFRTVTFSNARNRRVARGRGHKVRDGRTVYVDQAVGTRLEPGQLRWAAMQELLEQAGYLAWSSCDGLELVVGQPDYKQEAQYRFFVAAEGSSRSSQTNVKNIRQTDSTDDRYSRILYLGGGAGTDANYGAPTSSRFGEAKNNPSTTEGDGRDFSAPKRLILADRHDLSNRKEAQRRAQREMAKRDMKAHVLVVDHDHHGQIVGGDEITLFTIDTIAHVTDEETNIDDDYLLVDVRLRGDRSSETSTLELLPKGIELTP